MFRSSVLLALFPLALIACATTPQTGIMPARWTPPKDSGIPEQTVTIAWESTAAKHGDMTFTLGRGGQRYVGSYLLMEQTASHLEVQPLYQIWDSASFGGWGDVGDPWFVPGWNVNAWVRHYDGRVVVGLHGNRGGNARCHFTLSNTEVGIPGGGTGECQISDGGHLSVRF
ncbi:hypothetical protein MK489_07010 [Myxococcota bacterium]|nr:hypothetical protein [Myxococcota bacterium]